MGRPPKGHNKMTRISVGLPPHITKAVRRSAHEIGIDASELLRQIIVAWHDKKSV